MLWGLFESYLCALRMVLLDQNGNNIHDVVPTVKSARLVTKVWKLESKNVMGAHYQEARIHHQKL